MELKRSEYNTKLIVNGHTIIYNSISGKFVIIKNKVVSSWKNLEEIALSNKELHRNLIEAGIFISIDTNETKILENRIHEGMTSAQEYVLHVNPTLDCNFNCWYCYENHIPSSVMDESKLKGVKNFISQLLRKNEIQRLVLSFFGGEPLLHFVSIPQQLIQYAAEKCKENNKALHISFTTNGYLLNEDIITWLSQYSCGFQITLDGGKKHHDKTRFSKGGIGSFDRIVENIKKLSRSGIKVIVRVNFTSKNISSVRSILDSFMDVSSEGKKNISFDFQRVWQDWDGHNDTIETEITEIRRLFSENGFEVLTNYLLQDVRNPCYGDKINHALINYNGDVFGCTARDFSSHNRIGVLEEDGNIRYDMERYQNWRASKFSKPICRTCRIAPMCGGGCMQKAYEHRNLPGCTLGYSEEDKDNLIINLLDYIISHDTSTLHTISL